MNEELDSQLSAMFDDELPAAECELLARRLSRDEQLKARWGRYAAIGATIRAEGGVRLNAGLAGRVSAAISSEPTLAAEPMPQPKKRWEVQLVAAVGGRRRCRWCRGGLDLLDAITGVTGHGSFVGARRSLRRALRRLTATVAAIHGLRDQAQVNTGEPDSYVVPKNSPRRLVVPSTELANYVVAHSEFSSPVTRRNLLSAFMASESGTAGTSAGSEEPTEDVQDDGKNPQ